MTDLVPFGLVVLVVAGSAVLAVLSNRVSEKVNLPAPAIFLVCAAVVSQLKPELSDLSHQTVERIVTIAVAAILFDGGMHIGWSRLRRALGAVLVVGVVGTFVTAGAMAVLIHLLLGFAWWISLLVATAIAPTDPAVVFSVLGRREVAGLSGTLLEAESGANDPAAWHRWLTAPGSWPSSSPASSSATPGRRTRRKSRVSCRRWRA
jgi:cell volume regulation protein A